MNLERVRSLITYLADGRRDFDAVAKFIALKALGHLSPISIYYGSLQGDGYITRVGTFGLESLTVGQWSRIPFSLDLPITRSIKDDKVIYVDSPAAFHKAFPEAASLGSTVASWQSLFACPSLPNGVLFGLLGSRVKIDKETEALLRTVASLVTLYQNLQLNNYGNSFQSGGSNGLNNFGDLTSRQKVILKMLRRGMTNVRIAEELGYSESLVRQETVKIYSYLNVSGRKELLEIDALEQIEG
jgi:DNA-binding CsgD family transcriptional regulator